jgi:hypothetical protein
LALDTKLLMGAQPAAVIRDMQTRNYRASQVRTHLVEHVLPLLVEATAVVGPQALLGIPFPDDGDRGDQKRWFTMRYYSQSDLALKVCGKDGPNITAAIRATDRMFETVRERWAGKPPLPANPNADEFGASPSV